MRNLHENSFSSDIDRPTMNEIIEKDSIVETQESKKEFINSAEEVIIGSEQGTTFRTKVGSTLCNTLLDTKDMKREQKELPIISLPK